MSTRNGSRSMSTTQASCSARRWMPTAARRPDRWILILACGSTRDRQREAHVGALTRLAYRLDLAAVRDDQAFCDREPESRAARLLRLVKAVEHMRQGIRGDAGAGVVDGDMYLAIQRRRANAHVPAARRVAQRIR